MKRFRAVTVALIVLTAIITPAALRMFPGGTLFVFIVWGLAVLSALIWRAQGKQKQETESDLRAVALAAEMRAPVQVWPRCLQ